jgi:hypothetical protein
MATTAEDMYAAEAKENMSEGGKESGKSKEQRVGRSAHPSKDKNMARFKAAKAKGSQKADPELVWGYPPDSVGIPIPFTRMLVEASQDYRTEVGDRSGVLEAGELIRRSILQEWEDLNTCWNNFEIESH